MAGIYLHIPFCKVRCAYCDFFSTTREAWRGRYVKALCKELRTRKGYLQGEEVNTLYFGGGTPSQLQEEDFRLIFSTLENTFGMNRCEEITLEANPDDLTEAYVEMLSRLPFNRISMGIQTFHDPTLRLLNRRHNAEQARKAVGLLREAGFQNISIDLIYGLPGLTPDRWEEDLKEAIALKVEHISAYHLTYEEGTPLYNLLKIGEIEEVTEDWSLLFFSMLTEQLTRAGYEHYEISNFCLPGKYSRHNSAYWQGIPYLGCGPSAHSFDRRSREWNVASLEAYVEGVEQGKRPSEVEVLDDDTRYNEFIMTGLRTAKGVKMDDLENLFGLKKRNYCMKNAAPYIESGKLSLNKGCLKLTQEGIFVSDGIISDLMYI